MEERTEAERCLPRALSLSHSRAEARPIGFLARAASSALSWSISVSQETAPRSRATNRALFLI